MMKLLDWMDRTHFAAAQLDCCDGSEYGLTPAQYHAGLDKLWAALDVTGVQDDDVFTLCAARLRRLREEITTEKALHTVETDWLQSVNRHRLRVLLEHRCFKLGCPGGVR